MYIILIAFDCGGVENGAELNNRIGEKIREFAFARIGENVYAIRTKHDFKEIRDLFQFAFGKNGVKFYAADITDSSWATFGLPVDVNEWLKK